MLMNTLVLTTALSLSTLVAGAPSNHGRACGRKNGRCPDGNFCIPKNSWCTDLDRCHGRCVPDLRPFFPEPVPFPPLVLPPLTALPLPTPFPVTPLPDPDETVLPGPFPIPEEPFPWDILPFPWDPLSTGEPIIDFSPFPFPAEPTPIVDPVFTDDPILVDPLPTLDPIIDPFPFPFSEEPTPVIETSPFPEEPSPTPADGPRNEYPSCGGFRISPSRCPTDSYCADDPRNEFGCGMACDAPGICIPRNAPICGGFAGLQCPEGLSCYDYPADGCDPREGWSDCIGICL